MWSQIWIFILEYWKIYIRTHLYCLQTCAQKIAISIFFFKMLEKASNMESVNSTRYIIQETSILNLNMYRNSIFQLFLTVSKSQYFSPIWIIIVLIYSKWETSRNKLKMHSVTKNCSDLSDCSSDLCNFFLITRTIFSHSRSEQFW